LPRSRASRSSAPPGRHIGGDIGDGDGEREAAVVLRIVVGRGVHRVVVVFRIRRIDGDERQLAPILAPGERRRSGGLGLADRLGAEDMGNAVSVNGDQADRLFARHAAQPLAHARLRQAVAAGAQRFHRHEIAVARLACGARRHLQFAAIGLFFVHRQHAAAAIGIGAEDAERLRAGARQQLDDAAGIGRRARVGVTVQFDAHEGAVADAGRRSAGALLARDEEGDAGRRPVLFIPFGGRGDEIAIGIAASHVGEHDGRQHAGAMQRLAASLDRAFALQLLQHLLEQHPLGLALDVEGPRDLALADLRRRRQTGLRRRRALARDEGENLLARGQGARGGVFGFAQGIVFRSDRASNMGRRCRIRQITHATIGRAAVLAAP
jgi:hypothetical protein